MIMNWLSAVVNADGSREEWKMMAEEEKEGEFSLDDDRRLNDAAANWPSLWYELLFNKPIITLIITF